MNISSTWLTVNRNCNLFCKWCYAQDYLGGQECMSLDLAKTLIDIATICGSKSIFLIGGEPTIHPNFMEILTYILSKNLKAIVVTNGLILESCEFCSQISQLDSCKVHFGISIKGATDEEYEVNCGKRGFTSLLAGIKNCKKHGFSYSLSYVLTEENVNHVEDFAHNIVNNNIDKNISFIICNDTLDHRGNVQKNSTHPLVIDEILSKHYDNLCEIMDYKLSLHQTLPLCQCNEDLLGKMIAKNQITTSCHVHRRNGLIFDTDGSLLLCNNLPGFKVGEFGTDYKDADSLRKFWDSDYAINLYKKFTTMPSIECKECEKSSLCGGGCCVQWFSNDFESYKKFKNKGEIICH